MYLQPWSWIRFVHSSSVGRDNPSCTASSAQPQGHEALLNQAGGYSTTCLKLQTKFNLTELVFCSCYSVTTHTKYYSESEYGLLPSRFLHTRNLSWCFWYITNINIRNEVLKDRNIPVCTVCESSQCAEYLKCERYLSKHSHPKGCSIKGGC